MAQDISAFGIRVRLVASVTFPAGIDITQFADDADSLDVPQQQIADKAMGVNGDLITWSKANPLLLTVNIIPGSDDDRNMSVLLEANRVARGKRGARDTVTLSPGRKQPVSCRHLWRTARSACGCAVPGPADAGRKVPNAVRNRPDFASDQAYGPVPCGHDRVKGCGKAGLDRVAHFGNRRFRAGKVPENVLEHSRHDIAHGLHRRAEVLLKAVTDRAHQPGQRFKRVFQRVKDRLERFDKGFEALPYAGDVIDIEARRDLEPFPCRRAARLQHLERLTDDADGSGHPLVFLRQLANERGLTSQKRPHVLIGQRERRAHRQHRCGYGDVWGQQKHGFH